VLGGLGPGIISQVGDAAFGPMGKHMMFTGKQLVNDNVCFLHFLLPWLLQFKFFHIPNFEIILVWTLYDISAIKVLLQCK
jgi:hypothetical protein